MYVARPELGSKRVCASCAVRFYDLGRVPARCPTCLAEQPPPRIRTAPIPRGGHGSGSGLRGPSRTAPAAAADPAETADDDAVPLLDAADPEDADDDDDVEAEIVVPDEES